ncbi:hypothetical protein OT109_06890 [Phycisphaeraceae bacterium D3-23]
MGYFGTATVLTTEPDWQRLDSLADLKSIRGFRHKTQSIWLIETGFRAGRKTDWPFMEYPCSKPKVAADNTDSSVIESRDAIQKIISGARDAFDSIDIIYLDIAIRLAAALDQTVFTFAADDESTDLACQVGPDSIDLFASRSLACLYVFKNGEHQVSLYPYEEEPDETSHLEDIKAKLHETSPRAEAEIVEVNEGSTQFYHCAHTYWPKEGGNPETMLQIGTWDPFMNLRDDYEEVYEKLFVDRKPLPSQEKQPHPDPAATSQVKPWWKFW